MKKLFEDKRGCCGCGACEAACPRGAVAMRADEEGFLYPEADAGKCTDCGLCLRVCPVRDGERWKAEREPRCFAAIHKSGEVLMRSTSGGAFTAISDVILARGGAVCGADFDENFRVVHRISDGAEGRDRMRVSKNVQSDMRAIFRAVRGECEKRPVMFSGTPCQCAALLSYLGGKPENLFVCDLICHSIPSPLVWEEYKKLLESERGGKIAQVWFRSKRHPWSRANSNRGFAYRVEGSDEIFEDGRFYSLFTRECVIARPSCSACRFTDTRRVSDVTIADCFGIEKYAPEWNDARGVSLILTNTAKGEAMLEAAAPSMRLNERPLSENTAEQQRLSRPVEFPEGRAEFWKTFRTSGLAEALKK